MSKVEDEKFIAEYGVLAWHKRETAAHRMRTVKVRKPTRREVRAVEELRMQKRQLEDLKRKTASFT